MMKNKLKLVEEDKIKKIKQEIKKVYCKHPTTPFIIGYSGGKDSTIVLQLFIEVLLELKQENIKLATIYVISADTLVENPLVIAKTKVSMDRLSNFCKKNDLPVVVEMVYPKADNTFFANLIGRGYPAPLQSFRWCTDRIKIAPANKFITDKIDENGEIIMVLGTREEESISRKASMEKHKLKGNELSTHSTFTSAWTYAPIAKLTVSELWSYLLKTKSPWGDDNNELYKLYSDSSSECPLIVDQETKDTVTCGNSRFGCWTCTVVSKDKSLTGFIESGADYLKPLLDYRNYILEIRDDNTRRNLFDKNGKLKYVSIIPKGDELIVPEKLSREEKIVNISEALDEKEALKLIKEGKIDPLLEPTFVKKHEKYYRIGASSFTEDTRIEMLTKLLEIQNELQKHIDYELITPQEIIEIDALWKTFGYLTSPIEIYNRIVGANLVGKMNSNIDFEHLNILADKNNFSSTTLVQIISHTQKTKNFVNRDKNIKYIDARLNEFKHLMNGQK